MRQNASRNGTTRNVSQKRASQVKTTFSMSFLPNFHQQIPNNAPPLITQAAAHNPKFRMTKKKSISANLEILNSVIQFTTSWLHFKLRLTNTRCPDPASSRHRRSRPFSTRMQKPQNLNRQTLITINQDIGQTRHYQLPSARSGSTAPHPGELIQAFRGCPNRLGNPLGGLGIIGSNVFEYAAQVLQGERRPPGHPRPRIC